MLSRFFCSLNFAEIYLGYERLRLAAGNFFRYIFDVRENLSLILITFWHLVSVLIAIMYEPKLLITRETKCGQANFKGSTVERIRGINAHFEIVLGLQHKRGEHQTAVQGSFPEQKGF
jgi:hypothetical protein